MKNITHFHLCSHFYPATSIGGPIYCGLELLIKLDTIVPQEILTYSTSIDSNKWRIRLNKSFRSQEILPSNFCAITFFHIFL